MVALFERLRGAASFVTVSRKLRHWSDVPAEDQPALFMAQGNGGMLSRERGQPARLVMRARAWVYARTIGDRDPATVLNELLDAITDALEPDPHPGVQTLGGLVHHCWIDGEIETDEGALGDQAVAIVPITLIVNR